MHLVLADYAVTAVMLLVPVAIGVYYAWKDSKHVTREEYMLGGRDMNLLPVSLSIFVTYQSAISLIGIPSEVYQYGPMIFTLALGFASSYIVGAYVMVPLMYPLKLTSLFEYLEMRYESLAVRKLSTICGMLQTFFYMVIAMLAPGLAVQAAIGIPLWMSVVVIGSIGTVYTAIGGIKSVIWTDAFQSIVVFTGLVFLIVKGTLAVGGLGTVWNIAEQGGRTSLREWNLDPRTRHSWWGGTIGALFMWLTNVFNQSTLQRMSSMKNERAAKISFLLNFPSNLLYGFLLTAVGITLYAYFSVIRCDPVQSGILSNSNQMVLYFVLHVLQDIPGLAGLYMATIFSGALSTLSSGINSLATNTVEDFLGRWLRGLSEKSITIVAKVLVFLYGFSIIGVTYLAQTLEGPVTQMASSVFGACGSVVFGMFLVACTVPWANKYGAFVGGVVALAVNIWIVLGSRLYGRKPVALPPVTSDHCLSLEGQGWVFDTNKTTVLQNGTFPLSTPYTTPAEENPTDYGFFLYDVSYVWYSLIGTVVCSAINLIVSGITKSLIKTKTDLRLIQPSLRKFWHLDEIPKAEEVKFDIVRT